MNEMYTDEFLSKIMARLDESQINVTKFRNHSVVSTNTKYLCVYIVFGCVVGNQSIPGNARILLYLEI